MAEHCPYWKECVTDHKTGRMLVLCASEYPTDPESNDLTSGACVNFGDRAKELAFREAAILEISRGSWISDDGRMNIRVVLKAPTAGSEGVEALVEAWPRVMEAFYEQCDRKANR